MGRPHLIWVRLITTTFIGAVLHSWPETPYWVGSLYAAQLLEVIVCRPAFAGKPIGRLRFGLCLMSTGLLAVCFAWISIPFWIHFGDLGAAASMLIIYMIMFNGVITSRGSLRAFLATILPVFGLMLAAPMIVERYREIHTGLPYLWGAQTMSVMTLLSTWVWTAKVHAKERRITAELEAGRRAAEAAVEAKSAFVAAVSHELRTPINAIVAASNALQTRDTAARTNAGTITAACAMLKRLVDDLLDLSKIEAGKMGVEMIPFDLRNLVADTARLWKADTRQRGIRLKLSGAHALPPWVNGDPTRLRQVLNNLLSNAVKFTGDGDITLCVKRHDGDRISFAVTDGGSGLTDEQLGKLFKPFEQLGADRARTHGGTGLGLTISRDLTQLMGGELRVANAPGRGACFTLTLPLESAQRIEIASSEVGRAGELGPLRVLVVDDHPFNRQALTIMLEPMGIEVVAANGGEAALELSSQSLFDVILLDVNMPGLSGPDVARALRAGGGPNAFTPMIAVTGSASQADIQMCLAAGMVGHVSKPIDAAGLFAALEYALAGASEAEARSAA